MSPQDWLVDPLWLSLAMALVHFVWQGTLLATLYAFAVRYIVRARNSDICLASRPCWRWPFACR